MSKFMIGAKLHNLKKMFYKNNWFNYKANSRDKLILIMVLISVTSMAYLWQINGLATKGYQIKDLETKIDELRDENKKLELDVTDLRSTNRINESIEALSFVAVTRVEYLKANGNSVALNK